MIEGVPSSIRDHISDAGNSASIGNFCFKYEGGSQLDVLIHESVLIFRDPPKFLQPTSTSSNLQRI